MSDNSLSWHDKSPDIDGLAGMLLLLYAVRPISGYIIAGRWPSYLCDASSTHLEARATNGLAQFLTCQH